MSNIERREVKTTNCECGNVALLGWRICESCWEKKFKRSMRPTRGLTPPAMETVQQVNSSEFFCKPDGKKSSLKIVPIPRKKR